MTATVDDYGERVSILFRLPRLAYLIVLFLLFCTVPLAFGSDDGYNIVGSSDADHDMQVSPLIVLMIVPVLAAVFIARTATFVDGDGIRVRAAFGSRTLPWEAVRGLSVSQRSVYAVLNGDRGSVRLPCVHVPDLHRIAQASQGRLPEIAAPTPKFAPSKRRR